MDHGAVEEELPAFDPELSEAESAGCTRHPDPRPSAQPKGIKIGLANVPEARVGPGPGESKGLRLRANRHRVGRESLLHLGLFVEHVGNEAEPGLACLTPVNSTSREISFFRVEVRTKTSVTCALRGTAFQKDAAGQAARLKRGG